MSQPKSTKLKQLIKPLFLYCLILFPIAAAIMVTLNLRQHTPPLKPDKNTPDSFMKGIQAQNFNQLGNIEDTVTSRYISHDSTGSMLLTDPNIIATPIGAPAWHIHARHGRLADPRQKIVYLWGDVKISQPLDTNHNTITLLTSRLRYDGNSALATTQQPVTIIQPDSIIHGVGMRADIKNGDIKLLHQSHAQYVLQPR